MFDPTSGRIGRRTLLKGLGAAGLGVAGVATAAGTAEAASFSQNGFPVITSSSSAALDTGFHLGSLTFPNGVRTGNPHKILHWVANQFNTHVEALHNPGCWGWNYRYIGGSSTYSNHASGTALDFNAPAHPQGRSGTFTRAQRTHITQILAFCEGVVGWGGNYHTTVDEMHFEIAARWKDPDIARIVAKINRSG